MRTGIGGKDGRFDVRPDFTFDNLEEAVTFIVEQRPALLAAITPIVESVNSCKGDGPFVIAVGGKSRSGKSTFVSLLTWSLESKGIVTRVLSWTTGSSAPRRGPKT